MFEEIMAKNVPNLIKTLHWQIQEAEEMWEKHTKEYHNQITENVNHITENYEGNVKGS